MRRDPEDTRRRLLQAASAEFSRFGFAGARIERISAASGANRERIYANFTDKRGLFTAVLETELQDLLDTVTIRGSGRDAVEAFAADYFDATSAHPELARLAAWEGLELGGDAAALASRSRAARAKVDRLSSAAGLPTAAAQSVFLTVVALSHAWVTSGNITRVVTGTDDAAGHRHRDAVVSAALGVSPAVADGDAAFGPIRATERADGRLTDLHDADALAVDDAYRDAADYTRRVAAMLPDLDADTMLLFVLLARVSRLVSYDVESVAQRPAGLTYSSFYAVSMLAVAGPLDGSTLAAASGMSRAAVSALSATLERDGWIERAASDQDRRVVLLALTPTGRDRLAAVFDRLNVRERSWAAALTPEERTTLLSLLRRLIDGAPADARRRS